MDHDKPLLIYFDVCCLNRPFDDQTQDRIRLESEAIILILTHIENGEWEWLGSDAVNFEIAQTPDRLRRERTQSLTAGTTNHLALTENDLLRSQALQKMDFTAYDALHLAFAERGNADVLLTTDDKLLHRSKRLSDQLIIHVANPLSWLHEAKNRR